MVARNTGVRLAPRLSNAFCNPRAYQMNRLRALRILCWRAPGLRGSQGYAEKTSHSDRSRPVLSADSQSAAPNADPAVLSGLRPPATAPRLLLYPRRLQGKHRASQMRQTRSLFPQSKSQGKYCHFMWGQVSVANSKLPPSTVMPIKFPMRKSIGSGPGQVLRSMH